MLSHQYKIQKHCRLIIKNVKGVIVDISAE